MTLIEPGKYLATLMKEEACESKAQRLPYILQTYQLEDGRVVHSARFPSVNLGRGDKAVLDINQKVVPVGGSTQLLNRVIKVCPSPLWFWN